MNAAQQAAFEALAGRVLSTDDLALIEDGRGGGLGERGERCDEHEHATADEECGGDRAGPGGRRTERRVGGGTCRALRGSGGEHGGGGTDAHG